MTVPDLINGVFECAGAFAVYGSVRKLHAEKLVRGVSWTHVAFFSSWGFWNLYFYPAIDQWLSFAGGVALVGMNTLWLAQIAYYLSKEKVYGRSV